MPGSLGRLAGPDAVTTKRALIASSRLVRTIQRLIDSSHRNSVTRVWKQATSYRLKNFPIRCACSKISGANEYFSFGMYPVSSSKGR